MDSLLRASLGMEGRVEQSVQLQKVMAPQLAMDKFQPSMFQIATFSCETWATEAEKDDFNISFSTFPEPELLIRKIL